MLFSVLLLSCPAASGKQANRKSPPGIWLLLAIKDDGSNVAGSVERTRAVIGKRCRLLRISCIIQRQPGDQPNRLMLRFSTRMELGRVKEILLAEGVEVRPIVSPPFPEPLLEYASRAAAEPATRAGQEVFPFLDVDGETYLITERTVILTGNDLRDCAYWKPPEDFGRYEVNCRLKRAGSARLKTWTTANIDSYAAVIFNDRIVSAAYIKAPISYDFAVSVGFDSKQAQDLAVIFDSGNLPALQLIEEGTYRR